MPSRAGFIVQNAITAGPNLDLAEPDALDFNLLGNIRHGVIQGCAVSVSGSTYTVSVAPGIAVVDGTLVLTGGQVTLPTASQSPRFDLIAVDGGGAVSGIVGNADPNPVFPDYNDSVTILASVMIRPGATPPQVGDVTDKRLMLMQRFTTALSAGSLLHSANPTDLSPNFDIDFNGRMVWDGDGTALERTGAKQLKISDNLFVQAVIATTINLFGDLTVAGDIVGSNYRQGAVNPSGTATQGDIYRNTADGSIWAYQGTVWNQLSTVPIAAGMTMMGFMTTAPAGWLLVNGQTITQAQAGGLWTARPDWQIDASHMRLPDAQNCYFAWGAPGTKFGNASAQVTLQVVNLPPHKHLVTPTALADGAHAHTVTQTPAGNHSHVTLQPSGAHTHDVYDPGHHHPTSLPQDTGFLSGRPGAPSGYAFGPNPVVLELNTGENLDQFGRGTTAIQITTAGSNHDHHTDPQGQHTHGFAIDPGGTTHTHPISENLVGSGTPIDIRPPTMGCYLYVKT